MIIVKSDLNGDLRRFSLEDEATLEALSGLLLLLYPTEELGHYRIKYKDDEGDLLSITSTTELHEAIRVTRTVSPPILRLTLQLAPGLGSSLPSGQASDCGASSLSNSSNPVPQPIRIQGRAFVPSSDSLGPTKLPLGPVKVAVEPTKEDKAEKSDSLESSDVAPAETPVNTNPTKQKFGNMIAALADDTAKTTFESSSIISANQAELGASTAAMCNNFADSIKEFYSNLISETEKVVDPGAAALQTALDSLCVETANECERLQKSLGAQTQEQLTNVRAALNSQELNSTKELEDLLQQSITETHDLAASVLQKTRDQSLSFLEVMNQLHNDTVNSVLRDIQ